MLLQSDLQAGTRESRTIYIRREDCRNRVETEAHHSLPIAQLVISNATLPFIRMAINLAASGPMTATPLEQSCDLTRQADADIIRIWDTHPKARRL